MVYILNKHGKPLMPCSNRKARILLKENKAVVIKRTPFTIKLVNGCSGYKQKITLGVDAGSKVVGLSASTKTKEVYASEVTLRNDISGLITDKRTLRRTRRSRLRYRQPRFLNRGKKGLMAPSIKHKINTHLKQMEQIHQILPIDKVIVEVASFDTQKLKNPTVSGKEYQEGEMLDFFNVREFVLFRDKHKCQNPKCKHKTDILNVHHIVYKSEGGTDAPSNLATICNDCHTPKNHKKGGFLWDWCVAKKKMGNYKDATFMGIMRWDFYNQLKELYPQVELTFGYLTKNKRISCKLEKTHRNDAYCIASNLNAKRLNHVLFKNKIRRHNRQIHKNNFLKGHKKKNNQAPYEVKGFRLFDKVLYQNKECFITGRRQTGYFVLKTYNKTIISKTAKVRDLKLLERRSGYTTSSIKTI